MKNRELFVLEEIKKEMATLRGHLGMYYKNLVTGFEYGVGDDESYSAASVIKLPLFMHILRKSSEGIFAMDDLLVTDKGEKVPSCGALNLFTGAVECDIRTLCRLMICISDNTATNRLIRLCGLEDIERGFIAMGLEKTRIRRLLFDAEASAAGIQNSICPREMGALLESVYRGEFVSPEASREVMDTLLMQQINHKLGGKLCDVDIAHKTGEDDELSNDVGIILGDDPFILCFAGHDTDVYPWEDLIRRSTYALHEALKE